MFNCKGNILPNKKICWNIGVWRQIIFQWCGGQGHYVSPIQSFVVSKNHTGFGTEHIRHLCTEITVKLQTYNSVEKLISYLESKLKLASKSIVMFVS